MAESRLNVMKRVEANDPFAMKTMGAQRYCEGDYGSAFEYYAKAAVSHFGAHFQLSNMYREGQGVEKDLKKELYHAEQAAIGGHPVARYKHHGRMDRAVKHYMIAASLGDHNSLEALKESCKQGLVTKEDFAAALRAHRTAMQQKVHKEREPKIIFIEEKKEARNKNHAVRSRLKNYHLTTFFCLFNVAVVTVDVSLEAE